MFWLLGSSPSSWVYLFDGPLGRSCLDLHVHIVVVSLFVFPETLVHQRERAALCFSFVKQVIIFLWIDSWTRVSVELRTFSFSVSFKIIACLCILNLVDNLSCIIFCLFDKISRRWFIGLACAFNGIWFIFLEDLFDSCVLPCWAGLFLFFSVFFFLYNFSLFIVLISELEFSIGLGLFSFLVWVKLWDWAYILRLRLFLYLNIF